MRNFRRISEIIREDPRSINLFPYYDLSRLEEYQPTNQSQSSQILQSSQSSSCPLIFVNYNNSSFRNSTGGFVVRGTYTPPVNDFNKHEMKQIINLSAKILYDRLQPGLGKENTITIGSCSYDCFMNYFTRQEGGLYKDEVKNKRVGNKRIQFIRHSFQYQNTLPNLNCNKQYSKSKEKRTYNKNTLLEYYQIFYCYYKSLTFCYDDYSNKLSVQFTVQFNINICTIVDVFETKF